MGTVDIEISNHHFTPTRAMCTVKLKFLVIILAHESSVHSEIEIFLVIILAHESSVHCEIEIFIRHFSQWQQCALSKLKFLAIILPNESSVHCKNEIINCHFTQWEQCAL